MALTTKYGVTFVNDDGSEDAWGEYGNIGDARLSVRVALGSPVRKGRSVALVRNEYDGENRVDSEFLDVYAD